MSRRNYIFAALGMKKDRLVPKETKMRIQLFFYLYLVPNGTFQTLDLHKFYTKRKYKITQSLLHLLRRGLG